MCNIANINSELSEHASLPARVHVCVFSMKNCQIFKDVLLITTGAIVQFPQFQSADVTGAGEGEDEWVV